MVIARPPPAPFVQSAGFKEHQVGFGFKERHNIDLQPSATLAGCVGHARQFMPKIALKIASICADR
jgi:hypothetical protein